MPTDWVNFLLAFIEGFALIISPCILPILPIMLSGSLVGGKSRPLGIIFGFVATFTLVTLFSRVFIHFLHISPDSLRNFSFVILIVLGIVMLSSYLTEKFGLLTSRFAGVGSSLQSANDNDSGFWGGFVFGGLVGLIWTPCAGPILAAVIVQVAISQSNFSSILTVIFFAIGAGLPMLLIATLGRRVINTFPIFKTYAGLFRKLLGALIIASVVFLMMGTTTELYSKQTAPSDSMNLMLLNGLTHPYPAPQISGIDAWINSKPLSINDLKGKVILIDFWTYSCINCLHTLPYLKDWYAKYHDQGFEIIGVHSPEFEFEHDLSNVQNAVKNLDIKYPVALDNQFVTWQNYQNQYWPAHYLINKQGEVVYTSFGEGDYDVTENNIRYLLGLKGVVASNVVAEQPSNFSQTPETYFGFNRISNFYSPESVAKNQPALYTYPEMLPQDGWALQGGWIISAENITATTPHASIKLHFYAKKVYAVMGVKNKVFHITIKLKDKTPQNLIIDGQRLYTLIEQAAPGEGTVELVSVEPGLALYTFTFG